MRVAVTGCAGFVGSHLTEALLADDHEVVGIDALTDYYDVAQKNANLAEFESHSRFTFVAGDLLDLDLADVFDGIDVIYHQAGQPGVRLSWSSGFDQYVARNVSATQRVLEACRLTRPARIVYASSSSVYGNAPRYPTAESDLPAPHSPYGVTKLAAEHLVNLYAANYGLSTISLRYFTVYGPRQRPDMGISKFLTAALDGSAIPLFGDGSQVRDFTFVSDVVAANRVAGVADVAPGTVVNVAGGGSISVNDLLDLIAELVGTPLTIERLPEQAGDVRATGGSIDAARRLLDWAPAVSVREGVAAQLAWLRSVRDR